MADSQKRSLRWRAAGIAWAIVTALLMVLLTVFSSLNTVTLIVIAVAAGVVSAAMVYALVARSDPPTPEVHADQSGS